MLFVVNFHYLGFNYFLNHQRGEFLLKFLIHLHGEITQNSPHDVFSQFSLLSSIWIFHNSKFAESFTSILIYFPEDARIKRIPPKILSTLDSTLPPQVSLVSILFPNATKVSMAFYCLPRFDFLRFLLNLRKKRIWVSVYFVARRFLSSLMINLSTMYHYEVLKTKKNS